MIAEVPVGIFLSGGLDSSAILAKMAQLTGHRVQSFAVGYTGDSEGGEPADNEFGYARLAAQHVGADHHEYRVTAGQFRDFLPDLVHKLDEPLADPSTIPLYFLSRLAREHITVVLSGEGSDEILAGYGMYQRMLWMETLQQGLPGVMTNARTLAALAPKEILRRYLNLMALPLEQRYRGVSRGLSPEVARRLRPDARPSRSLDAIFETHYAAAGNASALDRMLYVDTKVWLPDDLLLKADKMTMANALELRVPFLDHELVQLAATLPRRLKIQGRTGKVLLRRAMRGVLPAAILDRPKKGFPVPTRGWFRNELAGFARDVLLDPGAAGRGRFEPGAVAALLDEHRRGQARWEQEIWTLLVFEHWSRSFLTSPGRSRPIDTAALAAHAR
jgi:asparagine synthase (glutamine-hydrolysing)